MIDQKVIEYIKSEIAKGLSREEITKNLLNGGGWTPTDIQTYFSVIDGKPVMLQKQSYPMKGGPIMLWNLFLLFVYDAIAWSLITIGENGVNRVLKGLSNLPDALLPTYEYYDHLRKLGLERVILLFALHAVILFIIAAIKKDSGKSAAPWVLAGTLVFLIGLMGWFGTILMCFDRC